MAYADVVMADAPVAYWRRLGPVAGSLPGNGGLGAVDVSGHNANFPGWNAGGAAATYPKDGPSLIATDNASPSFSFVPSSNVFEFAGNITTNFPLLNPSSMSMSLWVQATSFPSGTWADMVRKGNQYAVFAEWFGGAHVLTARVFVGGGPQTLHGPALTAGQTYHVGMTYDNGVLRLFLDGDQVAERTDLPAAPIQDTGANLVFAQFDSVSNGWNGYLDEVAIFNSALTPARMLAHYEAGTGVVSGGEVVGAASLVGAGTLGIAARRRRLAAVALTGVGVLQVAPAPDPPNNTTPPFLSGTPEVGSSLSCTVGAWGGQAPFTFTRQWRRNGFAITGATGSSYPLTAADEGTTVNCAVTATNVGGPSTAQSNGVTVTAAPEVPVVPQTGVAPNVAGWTEAQDRLRRLLGTTVAFLIPPTLTAEDYPPGTSLDPETGFPFDPTVEHISLEEAERVDVVASVVHRPIDTDVRDAALDMPIGLVPSSNAALIISLEDRQRTEGATEVEIWGERYRITEWRRDGLTVQNRWIVFTQER